MINESCLIRAVMSQAMESVNTSAERVGSGALANTQLIAATFQNKHCRSRKAAKESAGPAFDGRMQRGLKAYLKTAGAVDG